MNLEERWLLEEKYGGVESEAFHADLKRLQAGEPLGYLIGHVPFLNCTIFLDNHPLIPRVETEFWVEKAIAEIKGVAPQAPRILDLCAGSGAIGIAIAKAVPEAMVHLAEVDEQLLPTIGKNLEKNEIDCTHYRIWQSDLLSNINEKYDFILSNPPYIDPELDRTEKSVKNHEPHLALYGGHNGMELIEEIIQQAPKHLNQNGQLWLEHEPEQSEKIKEIGGQNSFSVSTHKDQYGTERYSILVLQ